MENLLNRLNGLEHWQIALIATGLILQGVIGAVFPEEIILTALGVLWSQGKISFFEAWAAVLFGLIPANAFPAFLGRSFGLKALQVRPLSWVFKKETVENYLGLLRGYGNWVIFFTRFTPLIRGPIYFATGVAQIGAIRFSKIDFLASCIHIPLLIGVGGYIGRGAANLSQAFEKIGIGAVGFLVLLLVLRPIAQKILPLASKRKKRGSLAAK